MTDDRRAVLRFGDDDMGRRPEAATRFRASYRVGNGKKGNVGAEAIRFILLRRAALSGISIKARNPLPAQGGTEPETLDEATRRVPHSIRRDLARAVTAADYAALAARDFAALLQGAAADLLWTGSWYEAHVTLDPRGTEDVSKDQITVVRLDLEQYRRMGHDLQVVAARYVPLTIELTVCVKPGHQQAHVRAALTEVFSSGIQPDGRLGFFHPDNLRFGGSVDASQIVAAAQAVEGVQWSRVTRLERLGEGDAGEVAAGTLLSGSSEIARVDSLNGFPERGSIAFVMEGGR